MKKSYDFNVYIFFLPLLPQLPMNQRLWPMSGMRVSICRGCPKQLKSHGRIAPFKEEGDPLILNGTAYNIDGKPAAGLIIYAYQTNNEGIYPKGKTFHGGFRSWVLTDKHGKYNFETIRPKAYPNRSIPEHIHLHVIEPQKGTYYIDSVEFSDDPLLTNELIESRPCRAGCGVTNPKRMKRELGMCNGYFSGKINPRLLMPNHVTEFKSEIELLGILSSNQHRLKRFDVRFRLSGRSCSTAFSSRPRHTN